MDAITKLPNYKYYNNWRVKFYFFKKIYTTKE